VTRTLRLLAATLLLVEALSTILRLASLLPTIGIYGAVALSTLAARGAAGAIQFAAGWMLLGERPPGPVFARAAFLISAVVTTLETGFRFGPTSADPILRWWLVGAYWIYALGGALLAQHLQRVERGRAPGGHEAR
jgi:hypothetical protein